MPLTYKTRTIDQTFDFGKKLAQHLYPGVVLLLFGDLGSGKTHLVKGIAQGLSIKATIKSPTFAYVNRYPISDSSFQGDLKVLKGQREGAKPHYFYHYDLYRLNAGDEIESIGLEESLADRHAINVIEWADRLSYLPQNYIRIDATAKNKQHEFKLTFVDPQIPSAKDRKEFLKYFFTPLHVRTHMKQVAKVSLKIARAYAKIGQIVNADLLYSAALLHDVARVCDFRELKKNAFQEKITDRKWKAWQRLREEYQGIEHPLIARDFLTEHRFQKTGELIYTHGSRIIVTEPDCLHSLESKILYYADKRVMHDKIVSLKERFKDGKKRYGKGSDPSTEMLFKKVKKKAFELEKNLFEPLKLSPGQIL